MGNYRRMGIEIKLLDDRSVRIAQTRLTNDKVLTKDELIERAKGVFPGKEVEAVVYK